MPCLCTFNVLRSFITTITELNPNIAATSIRISTSQPSRALVRRSQPGTNFLHSSTKKYITSCSSAYQKNTGTSVVEDQERDGNVRAATSSTNVNDSIVDFSADNIEKLVAEIDKNSRSKRNMQTMQPKISDPVNQNSSPSLDKQVNTPMRDLMRDIPKKKQSSPDLKTRLTRINETNHPANIKITTQNEVLKDEWTSLPREPWMKEKERTKQKYPDGYQPLKRLSPDAIEGIRALHAQMPERFTTAVLANEFKVSPEAIRRILKSKWRPNIDEAMDREARWFRRGKQVWSRWAELGATPPSKYRRQGIGEKPPLNRYQPDPLPELITTAARGRVPKNPEPGFNPDEGGIL
ncbi:mitochondrion organization and biogenesis protein/and biogenesis protein [Blumeria hordei DH14]|uniref:Required for respiratory growth protein 9, mitochondrial n=1 Tax=Blumeria graminis f. sp. hordei (strain DH14) TaxID=546991 RepID=N1J6X1_BLUG1|nr:mitochondrion organization and biogenesis protein/and biogenesis protein [Blumeria hordei DH14]